MELVERLTAALADAAEAGTVAATDVQQPSAPAVASHLPPSEDMATAEVSPYLCWGLTVPSVEREGPKLVFCIAK